MQALRRIVIPIVVAAGLFLLPLIVPKTMSLGHIAVASAGGVPTLAGEVFQASTFTVTGGSCQDPAVSNSQFTFTATGTAKGPVPGTYSESGTIVIGDNMTGAPVNTLSVSGSFTISGNNGSTAATGSVSANATSNPQINDPAILPSGAGPFGYCSFAQPNVDAFVQYSASVGNYNLVSVAELTVTPINGSGSQENFAQTFNTSSTTSCFTQIDMPFNGTAIPANTTVWMPAAIQVKGLSSSGTATINFTGQTVTLGTNGAYGTAIVPNGSVTFSSTATNATTTYNGGTWSTIVPSSLGGKSFFAAVEIPIVTSLPGSIAPVTWSGQISSDTHGLTVHWQWGAAVYTSFPSDYTQLGVKPVDNPKASAYQNSDNAGTPENDTNFVTGGARGGGGSNFTGSWSADGSCTT